MSNNEIETKMFMQFDAKFDKKQLIYTRINSMLLIEYFYKRENPLSAMTGYA